MAIPARSAQPGTYFVTAATYQRRRLFQVTANAELFLATLEHYREHFTLHAYVVMPDHIHLLLTPEVIPLERVMQFIKGGFSHRLASKSPVWQRGFTDHRIRDEEDFAIRLNYIHRNPVTARLALSPDAYPFSSAPTRDVEHRNASDSITHRHRSQRKKEQPVARLLLLS